VIQLQPRGVLVVDPERDGEAIEEFLERLVPLNGEADSVRIDIREVIEEGRRAAVEGVARNPPDPVGFGEVDRPVRLREQSARRSCGARSTTMASPSATLAPRANVTASVPVGPLIAQATTAAEWVDIRLRFAEAQALSGYRVSPFAEATAAVHCFALMPKIAACAASFSA
jgi:hypothetical protein